MGSHVYCGRWARGRPVILALGVLLLMALLAAAADGADLRVICVTKASDGQLYLLRVNAQGRLAIQWRRPSDGEWSGWSDLGGRFYPQIAVENDIAGKLEVFAVERQSNALECLVLSGTNMSKVGRWTELAAHFAPGAVVGRNADGRLEVFGVDCQTGHVKHLWQDYDLERWSSAVELGGVKINLEMAVAQNLDGRLELFGVAAAGRRIFHCWQKNRNTTSDWSDWSDLGGNVAPGFAVCANMRGVLELFAVNGANGEVDRICQAAASSSSHWTGWTNFGRDAQPGLAACCGGDGRMEVFAVSATNQMVLHRWELLPDGSDKWSAWTSMGQPGLPPPAVCRDDDGNLEVFVEDLHDPEIIHHRQQISVAADWLDWSRLDQPVFEYASRTWRVDEGLPDNVVQALAQTPDGYLWVGTRSGLAQFDGVEFTRMEPKGSPSLRNSSVTALCATADGALWAGTDGEGVVRIKDGAIRQFNRGNGLADDHVRVIYQTRDGALWVGTVAGLSVYHAPNFVPFSGSKKLASALITCLYEDREHDLWIATGKGLNRLRHDGTMQSYTMPNSMPNNLVRSIRQDKGGRIWIGSNNGLLWFNWYWGMGFYAYNAKFGLSDSFVSSIREDNDGNLWVGTYSGLNRFREGRFYPQFNNEGLPFDRVNALFEDREDDLWIGSNEGLIRLTPKRFITYTRQQGLSHNNVMSVLQDRQGKVWIGTWGGGVDLLHNDRISHFSMEGAASNSFSQNLILSLCEGRDGSMWIGSDFDGGLARVKGGKISRLAVLSGLANEGLRVLREDGAGNLWIGSAHGLGCLRNGRFTTNALTIGLRNESIRDICVDRQGNLWFATQNGLICWNNGGLTRFTTSDGLPDEAINSLYDDENGSLWIGTAEGGLVRLRHGHFTAYNKRDGLFSDEVFDVVEDDEGWLWMTCSKGVFRVRKSEFDEYERGEISTLSSVVFGSSDGMESPQCNSAGKPSAWKSRDGRLWFATSRGLVTVDPKTIRSDEAPPPVYITSVLADQRDISGAPVLMPGPFTQTDPESPWRIAPGRGELEIHYAAVTLCAPERSRYEYRLMGVDAGWMDAGTRRVAYYNNLAPGTYTFQVRACNRDGIWNQTGASFSFWLLPHVWQMLWFKALLCGIVLGAVGGIARMATRRRMQARLALLEREQAVERERVRIAKDMHDHLGAGLTQIGLLGEFARREAHNGATRHAERICSAARELAQTLDEIVWMVNPKNDTVNKLGVYLATYAEEFFEATAIRCRLDIPPLPPEIPVSAELRHNVFLVVKEALNNIVKHAEADEARVRLALHGERLEMAIEDNGIGFRVNGACSSRHGLSNMRARAEEMGADFDISSEPNKGTRISLRIPLHRGIVKQ